MNPVKEESVDTETASSSSETPFKTSPFSTSIKSSEIEASSKRLERQATTLADQQMIVREQQKKRGIKPQTFFIDFLTGTFEDEAHLYPNASIVMC